MGDAIKATYTPEVLVYSRRCHLIILGEVPILETDSLEDFEARMHATEHQMLIQAIALLAEGIH